MGTIHGKGTDQMGTYVPIWSVPKVELNVILLQNDAMQHILIHNAINYRRRSTKKV